MTSRKLLSTEDEKLSEGGQWWEQKGSREHVAQVLCGLGPPLLLIGGCRVRRRRDYRELGSDAFILLLEKLISKMLRSVVQE